MFTGLIEATGGIDRIEPVPSGRRLRVSTPLAAELHPGDSIAVNGVCLTVSACGEATFEAVVSPETLRVTTFLTLTEGRTVNLERPVRADGRLGGHFVLGHVDGVGRVTATTPQADCRWLEVEIPHELIQGIVLKGSIAIEGVSLTVASLSGRRIGIQLVPFTLAETSLGGARPGDAVNIETDVIGKYVARLLSEAGMSRLSADPVARERS